MSISVASATEDVQTDAADLQAVDDVDEVIADDDTGQSGNDAPTEPQTFGDLKTLIDQASAGSKIDLNNDYETGQVIVIKDKEGLVIDGHNHTLDGKSNERIFAIRTNNVTLQNIVFKNGYQADNPGGAVWASNECTAVTLINCTFINNKAAFGGAFYTSNGENKIINCTFDKNTATNTGGAIILHGNNNIIENCIFKNNKATSTNGGAVAFIDGTSNNKIIGSTFNENSATKDGGAIYIAEGNGNQISDNKFIKNSANIGGAVSFYQTGYSTVINNLFTDNTAVNLGGAIRYNIASSDKKTTISGNKFKNNNAQNSGALHIDGKNVEISSNEFDNNKATQGYAGTIQFNGNSLNILNNNITNTSAKTNGGAIVVKTGTSMTIKSNNIINAQAQNGGAIHVESGSATIDSNNFTKCSATNRGGAIKADTKVIVTENTFKDNKATDKGSDVFIYNGDNSQVKNNDFTTYTTNSLITYGNVAIQDNKGFKETLKIETLNLNYAVTTTTKYLTVVLKNSKGTGVSGKKLTITLNGREYSGTTNANGQFKTKIVLTTAKKYPCTVKFAGDDSNLAASYSFKISVNKVATKITSPAKTFKKSAAKKVVVTLKAGKTLLKKQKVTIKINKNTFKGTTNNKGKATIKIKLTKKGTFKGTLKFAGTSKYAASTGKVTIKIK